MILAQAYSIPFISKRKLAKDTYEFYFKKPEGFIFLPGQYNRWTLPITGTDRRGSSRFFTICSSPLTNDVLTITTDIIQSDFKKALLKLKKNEEVKIFGPMGHFILDESNTKPRVYIAGGIGITPFYSMLVFAAEKNLTIPLTLFASFSTPQEVIYFEELNKLEEQHPSINIIYTITKPQESQTPWSGETGRISYSMLKKYVEDITKPLFSIVGPPPMVEGTIALLKEMQIPSDHILTEQFTGY